MKTVFKIAIVVCAIAAAAQILSKVSSPEKGSLVAMSPGV